MKATKKENGKWKIQPSKMVGGTLVRKTFTCDTRKEAEQMAADWIKETTLSYDNMTLRDAFRRYIKSKDKNVLSPSTTREYIRMSHKNLQDIMDYKLNDLTNEIIQTAINIEAASHSPKTVRNINGLLTSVILMFRPDMQLRIQLPPKRKVEKYIPTDSDIQKLLSEIKDTKLEIPVLLAAYGPMRRGEICALTASDIHGNVITVNKSMVRTHDKKWAIKSPKTYAGYRDIEYPDFVIERIRSFGENFISYNPTSLTSAFCKALNNIDIPHFRFHDLRHYGASKLHAMGVPDVYIMRRGGWKSDYTMKSVYRHALEDKTKEFDSRIANEFDNPYDSESTAPVLHPQRDEIA